jgi:hypothetical protein
MAITNPKLFGLDVNAAGADVLDKNAALIALNLPPFDLDIIRGSQDAGATRGDWISLSRLKEPIYKILDRYRTESSTYESLLLNRAGTERTLFGNLSINGSLSGNAVRYRYIDGTGPTASIKIADISTSRVSSWSSSDSPVTERSPISYGARVTIASGGSLQFDTQSSGVTGPRLQTTLTPQPKEFDSELPTSKIQCTIGGSPVTLYAMKGIPIIFTGFFRNINATIQLTSLINGIPASWKIVETDNPNRYVNFKNQGGTTSTIRFRSSVSRERNIQFYYNPDNISTVTITGAGIEELPEVRLLNTTSVNFSSNRIRTFPDFTFVTPSLTSLDIRANQLYQSDEEDERKLNSNVLNKIPSSLNRLLIGQNFYGSIPQNIIADRFTSLTYLHLGRGGGPYFHPDTDDSTCQLPNVPNTCQEYYAYSNDFRAFGTTDSGNGRYNVKDLENLVTLHISNNYYLSGAWSIASGNSVIQYINQAATGLQLPTGLGAKQSLTTFYGHYCRNAGPLIVSGNYLFENCNSLSTLYLYASGVTGALPQFTNDSLSYLELRYTRLSGGDGVTNNYVIPERTFEKTPKLSYMLLQSGSLLTNPIHPLAFTYTPDLYYLWYTSYNRTTGNIPNLSSNSNLRYLRLYYNRFSGNMPNLAAQPNIFYVQLAYNILSGTIPQLKNLSNLYYLFLYNNRFTGLSEFQNLPRLRYFYAHNNLITGEIPSFADCPNLYYLILFNNKFTKYKAGALKTNYRLRYLDISGNQLTQQAVNQLISDLYDNYNSVNRRGVTINLRGNAIPSGNSLDYVEILRSKGWSIVYN